jgi:putative Mg2+ transporter-C (MgtC) family protein
MEITFLNNSGFDTWLPLHVIALRMALAVGLGGLVGLEREWKKRPAGLRTHVLVCLAAATAGILTIEIAHSPVFGTDIIRLDPIRLVEAVTAGVAFLAAGMIVFMRGEVYGLTTGAGMWLAATIGLAAGFGFWPIAVIAALLALLVLWILHIPEKQLNGADGGRRDN